MTAFVAASGTLEADLTVDDPSVYTRPWHAKRYLHPMLDTELMGDISNENENPSCIFSANDCSVK